MVTGSHSLSSHPIYSCIIAQELQNKTKNRYLNILPYDHSRVVLRSKGPADGFINASYIDGYRKPNYYIATQGPLVETIADFWQMIWQENSSIIVMLTNLTEQDKSKCEQYWPEQIPSQTYGEFTVTFTGLEPQSTKQLIIRDFLLHKGGSDRPRTVRQFHYRDWPDHGVPRHQIAIYRLIKRINQSSRHTGPIVIHCSAGVGRTGTFIAIDYLLTMAEEEGKVDVFQCVENMRRKRANMVQTK
ncbi:receptor-type tyrosine-protein phosphatase kappa-like, partial [Heptranchias perlo]|uniref:receptor-type tyrosine-protein phosphatase kappa-like n=1 Tax=Heptranchias perlo TaxID=212740 RepID=UPI003559D76C